MHYPVPLSHADAEDCTNFYYGKKAKALRLQLSTCFYYLAPFCVKVKGDDGIYPNPPSLIPFTTQKYV